MSDNTVFVQFLIEDSGIGIERQDLDKLFLPFVQADQSTTRIYGGSGLGLSIARKVFILLYWPYRPPPCLHSCA
jgi:signal transduction histidine kinase